MAEALGMGRRTGIELHAEAAGLLPNNAWKVRRRRDRWRSGDTCNVSIGQGALSVTPLQMAAYCAAVANGGTLYRPRLVLARGGRGTWKRDLTPGERVNEMNWDARTLALVRGGMRDVIHAPNGTGKRAMIPGIAMAGKTGSAEYGPSNSLKYGWMIVFAPFEAPHYAVAIVVEDAVSGGVTVAPRVRRLMSGIFGLASENGEQTG